MGRQPPSGKDLVRDSRSGSGMVLQNGIPFGVLQWKIDYGTTSIQRHQTGFVTLTVVKQATSS
jgi:hypothetical protein